MASLTFSSVCFSDLPNRIWETARLSGPPKCGIFQVEGNSQTSQSTMDRMLCLNYAKRDDDPYWPYEEGWGAKAQAG